MDTKPDLNLDLNFVVKISRSLLEEEGKEQEETHHLRL